LGSDFEHIRRTIDSGIPMVCLDRSPNGIKIDAILLDNVRAAQECVRHLIRTGYRSIAILTGPLGLSVARERLRGYEQGLREANIAVSPDLILEGDFREQSGYRLAKQLLLQFTRPCAILVSNGVMALGVLQAFEELGVRCPDDVAIATFDDLDGDRAFHPRLTVVSQPGYEMGARGATLLMDRIEDKWTRKPGVVRVAPLLVVRDSTRARFSPQRTSLPANLPKEATTNS
jgi:LacI family transcriptional regulator